MTSFSTNLNLILYDMITDGSSLFYTYVENISGSDTTSNMVKIDVFSGSVSGSLSWISGSLRAISASVVGLSGSFVGIASQITSASANNVLVSASGLAHSNYGKRTVVVPLNTSASLSGNEINYVRIPSTMNGWVLVDAQASCSGSSYSGSPAFSVQKLGISDAVSSASSMLSTNITIDEGEFDSSTAKVAPVISTTASSVFTGTRIRVICPSGSSSGSSVTYAQVSLTFENKP